ncbi:MAG: parallel beta-helix domain-containing protein [Oceanococcus sp.]
MIENGPDEEDETLAAFFSARNGDTIEFGEGTFDLSTTLVMSHKSNITIKGQGLDKTVLYFENSGTPEGLAMSHMDGIFIEDLTVLDTPGFMIKISDSDHVTLRNVRAMWSSGDGNMNPEDPATLDTECVHELSYPEAFGRFTDSNGIPRRYVVDSSNGGYAIYPVLSNNIILDNVISLGASDAGIYVGQSNNVIVKNSEALFNVAGYEVENTDNADLFDNVAHCNTGGFLVFDLPGINQYGERTRIFDNYTGYNNQPNFAPGGIVSVVPQGVGVLQLGYDEVEFFNNVVEFNRTVGYVTVSHEILEGKAEHPDKRMDLYAEGIHIHDNAFTANGLLPEPPRPEALICADGTGPALDSVPPCIPTGIDDTHTSLLPALIVIKAAQTFDGYGPVGAHIAWDGMYDAEANDCELAPEFLNKVDHNGKPDFDGSDFPDCLYNKYKFNDPNDPDTRKHPLYWHCYANNTFSPESRPYINFVDTNPENPPLTDISAHDCPALFEEQLPALPAAVVEPFVPGVNGDETLSDEEILAICENFSGIDVNRTALAYNCPKLSHYNLFSDATDPRSGFNEQGLLFDLTTPLFSDYASKYRVLFLPPGETVAWNEGGIAMPNAALDFPVGTVIAKTFSFKDGASENVVETRLLIHRDAGDGDSLWEGMAYLWETDENGNRTEANLAVSGGKASVRWDYPDPDPAVNKTYVGSTSDYAIPHPNQCGSCHNNEDSQQPGYAPIGPKVRLLNRSMDYDNDGAPDANQLQHWVDLGILSGAPDLGVDAELIAVNAQRLPRFDVPGDRFILPGVQENHPADSAEHNTEKRARAWLETNCAHCHNRKGLASSTGVFFDAFRKVDLNYGVCKLPNTAGSASGGRTYDIVPGSAADSIASFRIHAETSNINMPPIARSVVHDEAAALIDGWINSVIDSDYEDAGCE